MSAILKRLVITAILCIPGFVAIAANLPSGFVEILVAQNLDPTAMAIAEDGRLFVTEKSGRLLIVEAGQLQPDPMLVLEVDNYNERGLSGIALHPDFMANGYIYLYYTVKNENRNRVSRFTADGNTIIPGSEQILLNIDPLNATIHNAGSMAFGPDGKLYISTGDGGNGGAPQEFTSLLGKILRINDDGSIPDDNPFYTQTTGVYRAIYALGLRNSFSLAFQPGTGRIFSTEVGAGWWEEINEILPGKNYGWITIEGPITTQTPPDNYMDPVYAYDHNFGCAAVGAAFYNPQTPIFPSNYIGKFFFADYCRGYIKYLDPDAPGTVQTFATNISRPLNLLVAPDGTMYYLARAGLGGGSEEDNTSSTNGTLWRIIYTGSGIPFVSVDPQSVLISLGEGATFRTAASGQQPLVFQWQQNGIDIPGENASEIIVSSPMLSDSGSVFRCIVTNINGADTTQGAILHVTSNQRPVPEILTPVTGALYRGGNLLHFAGRAADMEQGELVPDALRWKIDFHHDTHTHPGLPSTGGISEGDFYIPQTGETADNVWYRIHLTATDANGLSKSVFTDVHPVKTLFHVTSVPDGLPVHIESNNLVTPVSSNSVVGIARRIEVDPVLFVGDSILIFREWSTGETDHAIVFAASDDTLTYTAYYDKIGVGNGTGLRGYYYEGFPSDPTFYEPYKFSWIDTTINFDWGEGSPASSQLGVDDWLVRWEGFIEPLLDDMYDFHVVADDGLRLWVNDVILIDAWIPQPPSEWTGSIALEAGVQYPIRLEFFEAGGGAVCRLLWSSGRIARSVVPRTQLYPERKTAISEPVSLPIRIFPNPVSDVLTIVMEDQISGTLEVSLSDALGRVIKRELMELHPGDLSLDMSTIPPGYYILRCSMSSGAQSVFSVIRG